MSGAVPASPLLAAVDPGQVTPGLLGFLVFLGLAVATWLLIRSMNRQIGKIDFDEREPGGRPRTAAPRGDDPSPPADGASA